MNQFWMDFHFLRPMAFLLAPVAIAIWWVWGRSSDPLRGWRQQMEPQLLNALTVGAGVEKRSVNHRVLVFWVLVFWLLTILAIAGPTWQLEPSPFGDDSTPLMILLKADASMLEPNPSPSRMERAHMKIADLADQRPGQPMGLIAYSGSAHLVLPPTKDTKVVAEMAREISPKIMPRSGDRLDLAIKEANRVLSGSDGGGSLLVLADTVELAPSRLAEIRGQISFPIQFLAVTSLDLSENQSIQDAAAALDGSVVQLDAEGNDISRIVRKAASNRGALAGEQKGHWQEAGYWLVPLIAVIVLMSFRREFTQEKT